MVVLIMLPLAAHGELEINAVAWTFIGDNRASIDVKETGAGSRQVSGDFLPGFGFGLVYWFVGAPFFGVGIDYLSSKVDCGNTTMDFWDVHCCVLFRIQSGQNAAFPHGRIVPYLGIGYVGFQNLSEHVNPQSMRLGLDLWSSQLVLKAGLEWMMLGWVAIFVEGRIMTDNLEMFKTTSDIYGGGSIEGAADIPVGQLTIGIALHIFK